MDTEPLLGIDDLARFLAVPPKTVYKWRHDGTGPRGIRVGRHVRYRRADVEVWLDERADAKGHDGDTP